MHVKIAVHYTALHGTIGIKYSFQQLFVFRSMKIKAIYRVSNDLARFNAFVNAPL
jgi:hypothetical protein